MLRDILYLVIGLIAGGIIGFFIARKFMMKYLKENPPKRILEIGAAVGYSAMCFSEFLAEDGIIETIERDEERIKKQKEKTKMEE